MNVKKILLISCITVATFSNLTLNGFATTVKETNGVNLVKNNSTSYYTLNKNYINLEKNASNNIIEDKKNEYGKNREKLVKELKDDSILVMSCGEAPYKSGGQTYQYTPNRNLYYLTGIDRENVILVITKKNNEIKETLFIESSNPYNEKWVGKKLSDSQASAISGIKNVQYNQYFYTDINNVVGINMYKNLYTNIDSTNNCSESEKNLMSMIMKNNNKISVTMANGIIEYLRLIKSKEECENIKKAVDITSDGIKNMMSKVKPGMMEYELQANFEFTAKCNGVMDYGFASIVAAGKNATTLHYSSNNNKIGNNELILCDVGAEYKYYSSDITRTFPSNGKFTKRQKQIYDIVLKAQMETIKAIKPGVTIREIENIAKSVLASECKKIGLIKEEKEISKYYFHAVTHSLGLDTHDSGSRMKPLKEGYVLAIEPGLYIESEDLGIRIEDDVLVTKDGCEVLSKNLVKTTDEIEKFMSENKK